MVLQRSSPSSAKKISIIAGLSVLAILVASLYIIHDDTLDMLLSQHRLAADSYSIIPAPIPVEKPPDRLHSPPKSRWDPTKKYLAYLPYGGISNQFYSFQNAATIAKRLNRTLVLPPIISTHHDKMNITNQPWSRYMDLDHVRQRAEMDIVEWHHIKHIDIESIEMLRQGSRLALPRGWRSFAERFPCQVVRGVGYDFWNTPSEYSTAGDFAYHYLLALEEVPVPGADRYAVTSVVDDIVRGNMAANDNVICLSYTFTAQFERGRNRWDISWAAVGQHIRFLPRFAAYVEDLLTYRFGDWVRYNPLTITQVLGEDPTSLRPPSTDIKSVLEVTVSPRGLGESELGGDGKSGDTHDENTVRVQGAQAPTGPLIHPAYGTKGFKVPGRSYEGQVASRRVSEPTYKIQCNAEIGGREGGTAANKALADETVIGSGCTTMSSTTTTANVHKRQEGGQHQGETTVEHTPPRAPRGLGTSPLDRGPESELLLVNKMPPRDYIAIHLRRGDIDSKCLNNVVKGCIIPLTEYKKHVDKIIADNIPSTSSDPKPNVILVSDTEDEKEKQQIDSYGWYRLDYTSDENLIDAWSIMGPFSPAFIDSAILTGRSARWIVGSRRSTMSWLAAMRLSTWHNRTIIYPALPPEALKRMQDGNDGGTAPNKRRIWSDDDEIVVLDRREQLYFDQIALDNLHNHF